METRPYWIWRDPAEGTGTDHGSTWSYDQRVPVMVVGGGLRPVVLPPGAFVDARQVAPTVAALARCPPPPAARLAPLVGR